MYTAIKINDINYKFKTWDIETEINWLNKINIFVGQNNSGKSRFLRSIFSSKINFKYKNFDLFILNKYCDEVINLCTTNSHHGSDFDSIKITAHNLKKEYLSSWSDIGTLKNSFNTINTEVDRFFSWWRVYQHKVDFGNIYKNKIKPLIADSFFDVKIKEYTKVYIPMLRGLKNPIKWNKKDLYLDRVKEDYFNWEEYKEMDFTSSKTPYSFSQNNINEWVFKPDFEVFTWLSLYEDIKWMLLWTHEKRENIKEFEKFLSNSFFENKSVTLTPNIDDDVLYVKIWNKEDIAIYDLWDWIQSIIINTFPLFKYKDENLLLFIEEPEMWIHPWMQRILLNTFAKKNWEWKHQIYFTTHSNHFLDIALDKEIDNNVSIYQFQETEDEKEKYIENITQNKEILDLLWVRNSSVFLSNCIIWVEWVSDRIYIKKFLELYQEKNWKKFEDDKHYSILEYGGGNITHFNFDNENPDFQKIEVDAISKNNFLIADNDGIAAVDGKKERLKKLKEIFWDDIFTEMPEIENLVTYEVYSKYFSELKDHTKRQWMKKSIFSSKKDFEKIVLKEDIGVIIKSIFIDLKKWITGKPKKAFQNTKDILIIGDKKTIAERLTGLMNDFDNLSNSAQDLTEKLYKFIESNNK